MPTIREKALVQADDLYFSILNVPYRMRCADPHLRHLLRVNYGSFETDPFEGAVFCVVDRQAGGKPALHSQRSGVIWQAGGEADDYQFIYAIEKDITLHLQETRPELFFLHAAALERHGRCIVITAASGTGKSTTTLALQRHGFGYLSDELAPVDLRSGSVLAYPHALCLKSVPPAPYQQLPDHLATAHTLHVPASALALGTTDTALPLGALVFLSRDAADTESRLTKISVAEATARLYSNALNALAHANAGLDAAIAIASSVPRFHLQSGDLAQTCALLEALEF